jgi:hypothetical protein
MKLNIVFINDTTLLRKVWQKTLFKKSVTKTLVRNTFLKKCDKNTFNKNHYLVINKYFPIVVSDCNTCLADSLANQL